MLYYLFVSVYERCTRASAPHFDFSLFDTNTNEYRNVCTSRGYVSVESPWGTVNKNIFGKYKTNWRQTFLHTPKKKGRRGTKKDIILSQNPSDPEKRWFVQRENLRNKIKIKIILRGWSISFIILPSCLSPQQQQQQKKRDLNLFLKNHKSIVSLSLLFVHFMNE